MEKHAEEAETRKTLREERKEAIAQLKSEHLEPYLRDVKMQELLARSGQPHNLAGANNNLRRETKRFHDAVARLRRQAIPSSMAADSPTAAGLIRRAREKAEGR